MQRYGNGCVHPNSFRNILSSLLLKKHPLDVLGVSDRREFPRKQIRFLNSFFKSREVTFAL